MNKTLTLTPGARAILHIAPGRLARYQGQECDVIGLSQNGAVTYLDIDLGNGVVSLVPASYLRPAETPKTPRRSPLELKPERDNRPESQKQQEGISWLQGRGYRVMVAGQFKRQAVCPDCYKWFWPKGGYGNSPGMPDVWVTHRRWGKRVWSPLEYKQNEKSERKIEQVELVEAGLSVFVWSLAGAIRAIYEVEISIGVDPHPEILDWLQRHNLLPESEAIK